MDISFFNPSGDYSITPYDDVTCPANGVKSFIRHSKPDYQFEVRNANYKIVDKSGCNVFLEDKGSYNYDLNAGDLFLSVINACFHIDIFLNILTLYGISLGVAQTVLTENIKKLIQSPSNGKYKVISNDYSDLNKSINQYCNQVAFLSSIYELLKDDKKHEDIFTTSLCILLDANDQKKEIPVSEIRSRFNQDPILRSIQTTMKLGEFGTAIEYEFNNFSDAVLFDMYEMLKKEVIIKRCENCGRYFIPSSRSDEKYCDYPYFSEKTCKQLGYETKVNSDDILKTYRKIYKTQNARKQRNRKNIKNINSFFFQWADNAKLQLQLCQTGQISLATLVDRISNDNWINGGAINGNNTKEGR